MLSKNLICFSNLQSYLTVLVLLTCNRVNLTNDFLFHPYKAFEMSTGNTKQILFCVGTGQSTDEQYYLNRPRIIGDLHGQAPMLWFAHSLLKDE